MSIADNKKGRPPHIIHHNGQTRTLLEWSEITGIAPGTLRWRVREGYTAKDVLAPVSGKRYTHNGQSLTIKEWSDATGINESTIYSRLHRGYTLSQALGQKLHQHKPSTATMLEYNGVTQSVKAWSEDTGIKHRTIRARLKLGWTIGQALGFEHREEYRKGQVKPITFNGQTMMIKDWANEIGVKPVTLYARLHQGWTVEQALTSTPPPSELNHGETKTYLYALWVNLKQRCDNPDHPRYNNHGALDVKMYPDWQNDFIAFKDGMLKAGYKEGLRLHRKDYRTDFEPDNIFFHDTLPGKKMLSYNGVTKSQSNWAKSLGISRQALSQRLQKGWTVGEALGFEPRKRAKRKNKDHTDK